MVGAGPLIVIDTDVVGSHEVEAVEQHLHVVERRDRDTRVPDLPVDVGPLVRIEPVEGDRVERGREPGRGLALRQQVEPTVGARRAALAREHPRRVLVLALQGEHPGGEREPTGQVLAPDEPEQLAVVLGTAAAPRAAPASPTATSRDLRPATALDDARATRRAAGRGRADGPRRRRRARPSPVSRCWRRPGRSAARSSVSAWYRRTVSATSARYRSRAGGHDDRRAGRHVGVDRCQRARRAGRAGRTEVLVQRGDAVVVEARRRSCRTPAPPAPLAGHLPTHVAQRVGPPRRSNLLIATASAKSSMSIFSSWLAAPNSGVIT